ncbi:MAG: hypothetical protein JO190_05780 [Candidatus Eremiobacteraeota bacterium]|nr:hypothetical protein [Candidatus Eremiobacteraeota bacterium]MBV8498937.1 hypothetical protein [Candidatus Eremiobacteraeota bacterium]
MLSKFAAAVLAALALTAAPAPAQPAPPAQPPAAEPAPAPDGATTARFTTFFTQVLGGHVPGGNISPRMKTGFTSTVLSQIDGAFAGYGKFRQLQFVRADTMQEYHRYHYLAVFERGSQGVMFVVDSSGTIVGFFQDQSAANPQ